MLYAWKMVGGGGGTARGLLWQGPWGLSAGKGSEEEGEEGGESENEGQVPLRKMRRVEGEGEEGEEGEEEEEGEEADFDVDAFWPGGSLARWAQAW